MYRTSKPLFLVTQTSLHAGSGDALGVVDLPIQRERHTDFPKIEASSLKGALREAFEEKFPKRHEDPNIIAVFGREDGDAGAAAIGMTDARLLLFPVKSMKGVFAWVTCPRVLKQLERDFNLTPEYKTFKINGLSDLNVGACFLMNDRATTLKVGVGNILLEEYAFTSSGISLTVGEQPLQNWLVEKLGFDANTEVYWHNKMLNDIVVLSDDDFKDFVNLSTEVITRIKIDNNTGTVAAGALFTEEYLPSESILYSIILASPEFKKEEERRQLGDENAIMGFFETNLSSISIIQLGGNATLGKGILRTKLA